MLITPETSDERIRFIDDNTDSFIYRCPVPPPPEPRNTSGLTGRRISASSSSCLIRPEVMPMRRLTSCF